MSWNFEEKTFADGKITFFQGNWFKSYQRIPAGSVDLVLTDPPYGGALSEKQDWDVVVDLVQLETTLNHVLKPSGQIVMFADLNFLIRVLENFGRFQLRTYHVWRKTGASMPISPLMPLPDSEFILVLRRSESKVSDLVFNPWDGLPRDHKYLKRNNVREVPTRRMIKSTYSVSDGRRWITRTLNGPNKSVMQKRERTSHPCQKPLNVLRTLVRTYSDPDDLILDPFTGSGSVLLATWREARRSVGFELERNYYNEAVKRIEIATAQLNFHFEEEHNGTEIYQH